MVLRLHVWGPAFGLASLDADCLATITYFAFAVPASEWELVATSPSAVPTRESRMNPSLHRSIKSMTHVSASPSCRTSSWPSEHYPPPCRGLGPPPLPTPFRVSISSLSLAANTNPNPTDTLSALYDTQANTWTTGFGPITAYLRTLNPAWDLDAHLSPSQRGDATAYAAFLASTAAPLIALSLYVSSDNWAATTRPAYSNVLPFPLTWTEPPAVRRRMCDVAAHLGLSDLNIDDSAGAGASASSDTDSRGFLKVPERLRPRNRSVKAALSPEQTALFRLQAVGQECLSVLADFKSQQEQQQQQSDGSGDENDGMHSSSSPSPFFFFSSSSSSSPGGLHDRPTSLDCLAFGYLALMHVPEVPRPWLRDLLRTRYECLCVFVDGVRDRVFGGDVAASLPWRMAATTTATVTDSPSSYEPYRLVRFARGLIHAALPADWLMLTTTSSKKTPKSSALLASLGSSAAALGLVGGVLLYRHLSPFGALMYRWELKRRNLGAAGAFFGI